MFKPFELFYKKKFPNEEGGESAKDDLLKEWIALDTKKKLKFIKKAEKQYDSYYEEHPDEDKQPFSAHLSLKELDTLLKSYGLPEKQPQNSRFFLIKKFQDEATKDKDADASVLDDVLRTARTEAEKKWSVLTEDEKNDIMEEYHKEIDIYNMNFFTFARNLPESRVEDYKEYYRNKKKLDLISKPSKPSKPKSTKEPVLTKRETKGINKLFSPFEIFYDKHKEEFVADNVFASRNAARAEANYDSYEYDPEKPHPLLASFLSKNELKQLFDSYGLPENVPNFSAYYLRMKTKEGKGKIVMKEIFEGFQKMSPEERTELKAKHIQDSEDYSIKKKQFLDNLPAARLEDFENMNKKAKKAPSGSPRKKLKTEMTDALSDKLELNGNDVESDDSIEDDE